MMKSTGRNSQKVEQKLKIMKSSQELLRLTVERGIASVRADSSMKPYEIEGSIEGFELCRSIDATTPDAMVELLNRVRRESEEAFHVSNENKMSLADYWRVRYREIQVEYVFEIMKFAWIQSGHDITTVSARSAFKFNEIMSNK